MYSIEFSKVVKKELAEYKKSNPVAFKKIVKMLDEMRIHPREGTGHPEALFNGNDITYSRRITKKDRLIYDIYDDIIKVLVLTAKGHYRDK
jgi:toxin YoeB